MRGYDNDDETRGLYHHFLQIVWSDIRAFASDRVEGTETTTLDYNTLFSPGE